MTEPITPAPTGVLATNPVLVFLAGLAGIVDLGLIAASVLDWVALTDGQTATIVAFVTTVTGLVAAMLRAKVYSPATVAQLRTY